MYNYLFIHSTCVLLTLLQLPKSNFFVSLQCQQSYLSRTVAKYPPLYPKLFFERHYLHVFSFPKYFHLQPLFWYCQHFPGAYELCFLMIRPSFSVFHQLHHLRRSIQLLNSFPQHQPEAFSQSNKSDSLQHFLYVHLNAC